MRLDKLKIGDLVVVSSNRGRGVETVEKFTPAQIVTSAGRYWKDGRAVGSDSWNHREIVSIDPKEVASVARENLSRKIAERLRKTDWTRFDAETLRTVWKIVREHIRSETHHDTQA